MKKVRKLLGLVLAIAMLVSMIPANAAETSTRVFFDDFASADWTKYTSYSGGSKTWITGGVLKVNQRGTAKKVFDTPYTGMVGG